MLFYMLQRYPNIKRAVINDINPDLICCYRTVRDFPEDLIVSLQQVEKEYLRLDTEEARKEFFMAARARYNQKNLDSIENTTLFFFLNRTCFNGLYRVNKSGAFNVPFGKYTNPTICDSETIRADSKLLQRVEICQGDFEHTFDYAEGNTFFYFDPPYVPLNETSSFTSYTKDGFDLDMQFKLREVCDELDSRGVMFMLSNSDTKLVNELYANYKIKKVFASRAVNANANGRGKITEVLVRNYD